MSKTKTIWECNACTPPCQLIYTTAFLVPSIKYCPVYGDETEWKLVKEEEDEGV